MHREQRLPDCDGPHVAYLPPAVAQKFERALGLTRPRPSESCPAPATPRPAERRARKISIDQFLPIWPYRPHAAQVQHHAARAPRKPGIRCWTVEEGEQRQRQSGPNRLHRPRSVSLCISRSELCCFQKVDAVSAQRHALCPLSRGVWRSRDCTEPRAPVFTLWWQPIQFDHLAIGP